MQDLGRRLYGLLSHCIRSWQCKSWICKSSIESFHWLLLVPFLSHLSFEILWLEQTVYKWWQLKAPNTSCKYFRAVTFIHIWRIAGNYIRLLGIYVDQIHSFYCSGSSGFASSCVLNVSFAWMILLVTEILTVG